MKSRRGQNWWRSEAALVVAVGFIGLACAPAREEAGGAPVGPAAGATVGATAPGGAAAATALTPAQRQALIGTYALATAAGERVNVRVFEQDGELMGQAVGQSATRLIHQGNNVFRTTTGTPFTVTFTLEGGRASRVRVQSQTESMEGPRLP
jgi:hypothetical protein